MYSSDTIALLEAQVPFTEALRKYIEPLANEYKVDMYFNGHNHMYEVRYLIKYVISSHFWVLLQRVHPNIGGNVLASGNYYRRPQAPVYLTQVCLNSCLSTDI